jgi:hypothetical protein
MKHAFALASLALFGSLPSLGCSSSAAVSEPSGSAGGEGGEAGQPSTAPTFGTTDCRACQADACASQEASCSSEPACANYLECLDACPATEAGGVDEACAAACARPEETSVKLLAQAVDSCRERGGGASCECGVVNTAPDVLLQECLPSEDPNLCYKCEQEKCCETHAECKADAECNAMMACVKACPGGSFSQCVVDCAADHPDGAELGQRRITCLSILCSEGDECGEGELDPCVRCVDESCTEAVVACSLSLACQKVSACAIDCEDSDCYAACDEVDPEGASLYHDWVGCGASSCPSECG